MNEDDSKRLTPHLDAELLNELENLLGDEFPDLIETFLADSSVRITELEAAIKSTVADDVRYAAHSFKGSSLNMGAEQLSDLCKELEDNAHQGRLFRSAELLEKIKVEFNQVDSLLRQHFL